MKAVRRWVLNGMLDIRSQLEAVEWDEGSARYIATFSDGSTFTANAIGDCSGIGADIRQATNPLFKALRDRRLITRETYGGVKIDFDTDRIVDPFGRRLNIWATAGSLTKGTYYLTNQLLTVTATARAATADVVGHLLPDGNRKPPGVLVLA